MAEANVQTDSDHEPVIVQVQGMYLLARRPRHGLSVAGRSAVAVTH